MTSRSSVHGKKVDLASPEVATARWSRSVYWTLSLSGLAISFFLFALSVTRPYVGAELGKDGNIWVVAELNENGLAALAGIKAGDQISSINGISLESGNADANRISGGTVRSIEAVDQKGLIRSVSLDGQPLPSNQLAELVRYLLLGLAFWAISAYVYFKRSASEAARDLHLLGMATLVGLVSVSARNRGIFFTQELEFICMLAIGPLFARLFVLFPEGKAGKSIWAYAIYVPSAIAVAVLIGARGDESFMPVFGRMFVFPILALGIIFGLISLVRKSVRAGYVRVRQQARIVTLGAFVGVVPFLSLSVLPFIIDQKLLVPPGVTILALVALPASIAYSLVRHRLFDIDLAMRRSLVHGLLSLILAVFYIVVVFLVYSPMADAQPGLRLLTVVAAGAAALLTYGPLRGWLQAVVDRRYYKDRRDYRLALRSFSSSLAKMTDPEEIAHFVTATVSQLLDLYGACLLLYNRQELLQARAAVGMFVDSPIHARLISCASSMKESHAFPNLAPEDSGVSFLIPLQSGGRKTGVLCLGNKASREGFTIDDLSFLFAFSGHAAAALENASLVAEAKEHQVELAKAYAQLQQTAEALVENKKVLEEAYLGMARTLVLTLESRDLYTRGHSERVSRLVLRIASRLGIGGEELQKLELAARLHDIGKTGVADSVLLKPGSFDLSERAEMERHPTKGVEILRFLDFLKDVLPIIESHHEWWDGTGYPRGLRGEEIPFGGRILSVADAYDAMVSKRPHRAALPHEEALRRLKDGAGIQWDPQIVDGFIRSEGGARAR